MTGLELFQIAEPSISLSASLTGAVVGYYRSNDLIISLTEEPHHFNAIPDGCLFLTLMPIQIPLYTLILFRKWISCSLSKRFKSATTVYKLSTILFWASTFLLWASTALHNATVRFWVLQLLNFDFLADPDMDLVFHSDADLDPDSQNNTDLCRSGSAIQGRRLVFAWSIHSVKT
jgi:hypothetical protein